MTSTKQHRRFISGKCLRVASFALVLIIVLVVTVSLTTPAEAQTYSVLYSFMGGTDGVKPFAGLVSDSDGNLYGTTSEGNNSHCPYNYGLGCGTVFKLDTTGNETVLHAFNGKWKDGQKDGAHPWAALVRDKAGNLYGTTQQGGLGGAGTVFKLNVTTQKYTTLHSFDGGQGKYPMSSLIRDVYGNLYGTTNSGGAYNEGGTIFKLDKSRNYTVLYSFSGGSDGAHPWADLVRDKAGNLYGTTVHGGDFTCNKVYGCGTVFRLNADGSLTVLHKFAGRDGSNPVSALVRDKAGNLYGTTSYGGYTKCHPANWIWQGCGTVFKLDTAGRFRVLHRFTLDGDGGLPAAGLVRDMAGNLYGTTQYGGDLSSCPMEGCGTVFKLDKAGVFTVLHRFNATDGTQPLGTLLLDSAVNLYGTTSGGGAYWRGVIFKIAP